MVFVFDGSYGHERASSSGWWMARAYNVALKLAITMGSSQPIAGEVGQGSKVMVATGCMLCVSFLSPLVCVQVLGKYCE